MNLVGKIFVVLIFVMSLVFATFSIMVYSTHKNWKDEILRTSPIGSQGVGWQKRYEEKTNENTRLKSERDNLELQLTAERMAKGQALAKSEQTVNTLRAEDAAKDQQLRAKEAALLTNTEALHAAEKNLAQLTTEVNNLRSEIATSQHETDEQIKRANMLHDKYAVASNELTTLTERNLQLADEVTRARALLKPLGKSTQDPIDGTTIPVNGVVTAVSRSQIELSIGTDDGVRKGQELDIYRGDKYVGRVRVIEVKPDNAVGAILTEYQQYPIQRGDNVASRLKST